MKQIKLNQHVYEQVRKQVRNQVRKQIRKQPWEKVVSLNWVQVDEQVFQLKQV